MATRRRKKKPEKKIEASKLIMAYVLILTTIIVFFTMIMVAITKDSTPLLYLIPAIFAELATGTGFYYSKAKAENEIKIGRAMPDIRQPEPAYPVDYMPDVTKITTDIINEGIDPNEEA